jgi:hypothetical protein
MNRGNFTLGLNLLCVCIGLEARPRRKEDIVLPARTRRVP